MKFFFYVIALWGIGLLLARFYLKEDIRRHFGPGLFASFAIITCAALIGGNQIAFFGLCFVCFFIGVRTPLDAACRFLLLTALIPNVTLRIAPGGIYIMDLLPIRVFSLAFAITCVAKGGWRRGARLSSEDIAFVALAFIVTFGQFRDASVTSLARQVASLLFMLFPLFLLRQFVRDRGDSRALIGVLIGAGAILAVIAIYEAIHGWSLFDPVWQRLNEGGVMSRNLRVRAGLMRSPTTFAESTSFAVFQLAATAAALFARRIFRSTAHWLLCCGQMGVGLLCAQSRGALLGLFVAVIVTFVFRRAYAKAAGMAATAIASVGVLLALARTNSRVAGFMQADAALHGEDYRQRLLTRGLEVGFQHPWFGTDIAYLNQALADMTQGEHIVDFVNSYLGIFLNGGLIGLAAIILPLIITYSKLWRSLRATSDSDTRTLRSVAVIVLTGVLSALAFTSLYERNPVWLLVALIFAKAALDRRPKGGRHLVSSHARLPEVTTNQYHAFSSRAPS